MTPCIHVCLYVCILISFTSVAQQPFSEHAGYGACMYICTHVCILIYVSPITQRPFWICRFRCMYACMHACMYVCMYTDIRYARCAATSHRIWSPHFRAMSLRVFSTCESCKKPLHEYMHICNRRICGSSQLARAVRNSYINICICNRQKCYVLYIFTCNYSTGEGCKKPLH